MASCGDTSMSTDVTTQDDGEMNSSCQNNDIISYSVQHGLDHITENILDELDDKSLLFAEQVAVNWRKAIKSGRFWKNNFLNNAKNCHWSAAITFRKYDQYLNQSISEGPSKEHDLYKSIYIQIDRDVHYLKINWMQYNFHEHSIATISRVNHLHFNHEKIATATQSGKVYMYSIEPLRTIKDWSFKCNKVTCILLFENVVFAAFENGSVIVWDSDTGEILNTLKGHNNPVRVMKIVAGILMTCSKDGTIVLWEIDTLASINEQMTFKERKILIDADFDGNLIAMAYNNRWIKVWQTSNSTGVNAEIFETQEFHDSRIITCLKHNGKLLIVGSDEGTIRVWEIGGPTITSQLIMLHRDAITSINFVNGMVVSSSLDGRICVWNFNGSYLQLINDPNTYPARSPVVFMHADDFLAVYTNEKYQLVVRNYLTLPNPNSGKLMLENGV